MARGNIPTKSVDGNSSPGPDGPRGWAAPISSGVARSAGTHMSGREGRGSLRHVADNRESSWPRIHIDGVRRTTPLTAKDDACSRTRCLTPSRHFSEVETW